MNQRSDKIREFYTAVLPWWEMFAMQKQLTFVIVAAVLMAAAVTVALYTANVANAQGNMTGAGAAKNMTGAASALKNMTKK